MPTCIFCGSGGDMLPCSGIGCPLFFHSLCIPYFNSGEELYCLYYTYKDTKSNMMGIRKRPIINEALYDHAAYKKGERENVGEGSRTYEYDHFSLHYSNN